MTLREAVYLDLAGTGVLSAEGAILVYRAYCDDGAGSVHPFRFRNWREAERALAKVKAEVRAEIAERAA